jgi:hypothetical protein
MYDEEFYTLLLQAGNHNVSAFNAQLRQSDWGFDALIF